MIKIKTLFRHPADDEFAAEVLSDLRAAGRFVFELVAFCASLAVFGAAAFFVL